MSARNFLVLGFIGASLLQTADLAAQTNAPSTTAAQATAPKEFVFQGGNIVSFVNQVKGTFGIDLWEMATIPDSMRGLPVPKMRINHVGGFRRVLTLYNSISGDEGWQIGKWIIKDPELNYEGLPEAVVLVKIASSDGAKPEIQHVVRAFAYRGLQDKQLNILEETILRQQDLLARLNRNSGLAADLGGDLQYHKQAGILVATGTHGYVEMAGTIIDAFRQSHPPNLPEAVAPIEKK